MLIQSFIATFVDLLLSALTWALIIRALLSWFGPLRPGNPFFQLAEIVYHITEPILLPMRRIIPPLGMFDMSFLVTIILIEILHGVLCAALGCPPRRFF